MGRMVSYVNLFSIMEILASMLTQQQQQLIRYDRLITQSDKSLEEVGGKCGDILQHSDEDFRCLYLNPEGRDWFGLDAEKMNDLKNGVLDAFYHPDTLNYELPKIRGFYKSDRGNEIYSTINNCTSPGSNVIPFAWYLPKRSG